MGWVGAAFMFRDARIVLGWAVNVRRRAAIPILRDAVVIANLFMVEVAARLIKAVLARIYQVVAAYLSLSAAAHRQFGIRVVLICPRHTALS